MYENFPRSKWFRHDRFGMFIHWGLYSIPARGEWGRGTECYEDAEYYKYFEEFNPTEYDPAAWAKLAKAAGMKYAVLTAKHHDGFCLFDSATPTSSLPTQNADAIWFANFSMLSVRKD